MQSGAKVGRSGDVPVTTPAQGLPRPDTATPQSGEAGAALSARDP